MKKMLLLLLLGILFALSAYSNKRMISSTSIRTSDGLSGDMISAIVQDSIGYLWIRTTEGVDRFDGTNFRSFTTQSDFRGLTFTPMNELGVDGLGNVWIISRTGIDLFDYKVDSIIDLNPNRHHANFDEPIMAFAFTSNRVWFADKSAHLWSADVSLRKFNQYPIKSSIQKITAIHEDANGNLWIAGKGRIDKYALCNNKHKTTYYLEGSIKRFYADSDGDLWICTDECLYCYKTKADKLLKIEPQHTPFSNINMITEAGKQVFYLGTSDFLFTFHKQDIAPNGRISNYQRVDESDTGEFYSSIQTLLADKKGNLWIGTFGKGVVKLNNRKNPFRKLNRNSLLKYTISDDKTFSICFDKDNGLWLGTDGGGINRIDMQTHEAKNYNTKNGNAIIGDNATASCCDEQGFLWFGNRNAEISRFDPKSGKRVNYQIQNESFIRNISTGDHGKMWFSASNGLYYFNPSKNEIIPYNPGRKSMKYTVVKAEQTSDSTLWFATYKNGLFRCNLKDNSCHNYLAGLGYYGFNDFLIQGDTIYICTSKNGVLAYSIPHNKVVYTINDVLDMRSNHANAILADEKGDLWISTNVGISRFSMKEQKVRNFYTKSGVMPGQFIARSKGIAPNGMLVFGNFDGLNFFHPQEIGSRKRNKVIMESFLCRNEKIYPGEQSLLKKHLLFTDQIELEYDDRYFSVVFTAIDYSNMGKMNYRYRLDGFDNDWIKSKDNFVDYSDLPPGKYTLKVSASNDGYWDNDYTELGIIIKKPFYLKWYALLIYAFLSVSVCYFVWWITTLRHRTENRIRQEKAEREKNESLYKSRIELFTNISHEFRTPLSLIKAPCEKIQKLNDNKLIAPYLNLINLNAIKLLDLIDQLLDFSKFEHDKLKLKLSYLNIDEFLQALLHFFNQAHLADIRTEYNCSLEDKWVYFDPNYIHIVVSNILSNAFKYTPKEGTLQMTVYLEDQDICIRVFNSGSYIAAENLSLVFERYYQQEDGTSVPKYGTGIGLNFARGLINKHKGNIWAESTEAGTVFYVTIPQNKTLYAQTDFLNDGSQLDYVSRYEVNKDASIPEEFVPEVTHHEETLLLVEDEPDLRMFLVAELSKYYNVISAINGTEALENLKDFEIDLILSDVMMPQMGGLELCERIKSTMETSHIPVVLLTAKGGTDNSIKGLKSGADSYIAKPFNLEYLLAQIKSLIASRKKLREKYVKTLIIDEQEADKSKVQSPDELLMSKILDLINKNMSNPDLNGDTICAELAMSRSSLHRKVKSLTGKPIGDLIKLLRLHKAQKLLETSQLTITEICFEVGFSYPSYFTTLFTAQFNVTPTEYRKKEQV